MKPPRGHGSTKRRASCATIGWNAWISHTRMGEQSTVARESSACRTRILTLRVVSNWTVPRTTHTHETMDLRSGRQFSFHAFCLVPIFRLHLNPHAIVKLPSFLGSKHVPLSNKRFTPTKATHQVGGMQDGGTSKSISRSNEFARLEDGPFGFFNFEMFLP